ncbi:carboxymuconolactone decarboxylase family protein [Agromyces aerolatus]|uniref:carboxymuconolactone decarboxylase family protein n=1 Tax=Agromyces sp. LY-1074 TaxID=3074080 RepID=UPI0028623E19|nr:MULTISPECIES: carboxymuconolactone decarboxylase family protein [unclassified Agromyces]MDR5700859.1 carboxymuconolactone decarboxylase family protein [Agromyces sp. LY-1074]MDR5707480.1 carboxymuconolactone decarboxylase family protein [Agromyces sp. LY-1358]
MSGLEITPVDELDEIRAAVHRAIATGRRADFFRSMGVVDPDSGLPGPFNAMVRAPAVGMPLHRLGEALRYGGTLPPLVREVVILCVATARRSPFEWRAHLDLATKHGADEAMIDALRHGETPADPAVADAVTIARALLERTPVSDALLGRVLASYGEEGAVELVVLVGYYDLLATLMRTFAVE